MQRLRKNMLDGHVDTLLLAVLEAGPSYGYEIVRELNNRAEGLLKLGEGTVYPVLHRMEDRGLIASQWREGRAGRPRKYYKLTPAGRKAMVENRRQWAGLVRVMEAVVGSETGGAAGASGDQLKPNGGIA